MKRNNCTYLCFII